MNKRLTTAISFISMTIGIWLTSETIARADHSLANAMSDSETISQAVAQIQSTHDVICDTDNSNQIYHYPSEKGEAGSAWKQIALCYQDENSLKEAREYFINGGSLGFYGAPGIMGVLIVSYTWEDYKAERLISIEYK
ncbi:hypothetical protein [Pleurocapsa sp. FMAR1]|uniref:hypothetical protein n=1 Tax=Pleurocapsa sp. FMAR1 TaxID=3040204 RepID=UPI0029C8F2E1|nr:hypothetical protein [Pleurocapsa sp. FMAR1]